MKSEKDFLTMDGIVLFEVIVVIDDCLESGVVNTERDSSDSRALWKTVRRL